MTPKLEGVCALLQVFDMRRSFAFYRDVLGFAVVESAPPGDEWDWCMLRQDDTYLMLNTMYERDQRPEAPDPVRVAAHADTTLYFRCRDLDAAYAHVREHGIAAELSVVRDYGMR